MCSAYENRLFIKLHRMPASIWPVCTCLFVCYPRDGEMKQRHCLDYCFFFFTSNQWTLILAADLHSVLLQYGVCLCVCVFHLFFALLQVHWWRMQLLDSYRTRCFSMTLTYLSLFFCLQCAGWASTSPRLEIWSVQSVRLTVSLTMKALCTAAVRKTTSVLTETPSPWPVLVSVCLYLT